MGSKVQSDNYLPRYCSVRDLNHDSNGMSWPQYYGENHLPNGQFHYSVTPKPTDNMFPGFDKDLVKQTMLKHEAIFKNQVFELHRLYRVQKDLMDEAMRKQQYTQKAAYETSSSSSALPSQMPSEDSQRHYSSSFPFGNSLYNGAPPVSCPEINHTSPIGNILKGKNVQASPVSIQKYSTSSPKHSAASETRPTKVRRKMLDLTLPADEYIDVDEVEQGPASGCCGKTEYQEDGSRADSSSRKPIALADLNEPVQSDEANVDPSEVLRLDGFAKSHGWSKDGLLNSKHGSANGNTANLQSNGSKENELDWLSSLKAVGSKDGIRCVQQDSQPDKVGATSQSAQQFLFGNQHRHSGFFPQNHVKEDPWPVRASESFKGVERNHNFYSYHNPEPVLFSHHSNLPPSSPSSELANPLDQSATLWNKQSSCHSRRSISVYSSPLRGSTRVSKSFQSTAQSNELSGNRQNMSGNPTANHHLQNDHNALLSAYKESPPFPLSKGGYSNYMNCNYNGKSTSGSSSDYVLKGTSVFDLNTTRDLNLNVVHPNGLSAGEHCSQPQASNRILDDHLKHNDPLPAFPWLRGKAVSSSPNASASARDAKEKSDSGRFQGVFRSAADCQNLNASTSCSFVEGGGSRRECAGDLPSSNSKKFLGVNIFQNPPSQEEEIPSGRRKSLFDINMPCDPSDHEFDSSKPASSNNVIVEEKIEATVARGLIDLNSCVEEDEVPMIPCVTEGSTPSASSAKRVGRGIIDLEAVPDDVEDDDQEAVKALHHITLEGRPCDVEEDEIARVAAEAIIAISSFSLPQSNNVDEEVSIPVPVEEFSTTEHPLHWFADVVSTYPDGEKSGRRARGSDDFESMTLSLTECSEEDYLPQSSAFDIPSVLEDPAPTPVLTGRPRRGPARRGRQRRDFQRDILPGLTSLSRHEVTEDLQTFGGLMRATGYAWQCGSRRNGGRNGGGRGRRRSVVAIATPPPPPPPPLPPVSAASVVVSNIALSPTTTPIVTTVCATPAKQQQVRNGEIHFEGWGKATRRPRRQRCPPQSVGNPTSVPST